MKKRLAFCFLIVFPLLCHGKGKVSDYEGYTAKPCSDEDIIMQVHYSLKTSLPDLGYGKKPSEESEKLYKKISSYVSEFDPDNKNLKFKIKRISAQRMTRDEKIKLLDGEKDYDNYLDGVVYNEYYKIKNSNGNVAIYETFNNQSSKIRQCNSIGAVYIVDYDNSDD